MFRALFHHVQETFSNADLSENALRFIILGIAAFWSLVALTVKNKWILGGIIAYLILP